MDKRSKSLIAHYKKAIQVYHPNLDLLIDEKDVGKWYCRIRDIPFCDNDEYKDGEYIFDLIAPKDYPFAPAEFRFKTPNGVYNINQVVCVDNGEFHKDKYAAGKCNMFVFATELLSRMINWKDIGVGFGMAHNEFFGKDSEGRKLPLKSNDEKKKLLDDLLSEKKALAKISKSYNREKFPDLIAKFDDPDLLNNKINKVLDSISKLNLSENLSNYIKLAITG